MGVVEVRLTEESLRHIALFERLTGTHVKDCVDTEEKLIFIVEPGQGSRAVGKKGEHVIRLKELTGKNIQVIEYSDDPATFIRNVFHTYAPQGVQIEPRGSILHATVTVDPQSKAKAIGKNGRNLRLARDIVHRHHKMIQSLSVA